MIRKNTISQGSEVAEHKKTPMLINIGVLNFRRNQIRLEGVANA